MAVVAIVALAPSWVLGTIPWWLWVGPAALVLLSSLSLTASIGASERDEADPGHELPNVEERRSRGRVAGRIYTGFAFVTFPIVGYLIDGLPSAIFFLVLGGLGAGLGLWATERRFSDN